MLELNQTGLRANFREFESDMAARLGRPIRAFVAVSFFFLLFVCFVDGGFVGRF